MISDIPFDGPVGAVRVVRKNGKMLLNPTYNDREEADMEIIFSGVRNNDGKIILNMIEGGFNEVDENSLLEASDFAEKAIADICQMQNSIVQENAKQKIVIETSGESVEFEEKMRSVANPLITEALSNKDKTERNNLLNKAKEALEAIFKEDQAEEKDKIISNFIEKVTGEILRDMILNKGKRPDGRNLNELRELNAQIGLLPRTHGSGLFTRGQTKSLSIVTLGSPSDQLLFEEMESTGEKRFMHHYNFPPYSVGEVKPMRGPGRRDIGHGMLVEKAIIPVLPKFDDFPYTIRVVSEILSSNGSTSMASTCAASLALMDAGVTIKRAVAGISIGIILDEESGKYKLLTDIQGLEDHHGGMDFKVTGTSKGLTAIQMDVKIRGIDREIFSQALIEAKKAREKILDKMTQVISTAKETISPYAPRVITFQIDPEKIGEVIGPGGRVINEIIDETGATIDIKDSGIIFITSEKEDAAWKAVSWIKNITREVKVGEIFQGKVKRIIDFGAFVEILPNQEGLVHISKLADHHVNKVSDIVKVGEMIPVKVIEIDGQGRINLSLKDALKNS
jgi:polyribonucleotide nucleotidyltransferase